MTNPQYIKALTKFWSFNDCTTDVCPEPTRTFKIGDRVDIGNLCDVVVVDVLTHNKVYIVEYNGHPTRNDPTPQREIGCWWWYDVQPINTTQTQSLFSDQPPGTVTTTPIDSLFMNMAHNGLVCDPTYQRQYVWSEHDQYNLLQSIFNHTGIGSFVLIKNLGYLHPKEKTRKTYVNLDGKLVDIHKHEDYTTTIVDGQQRITTLWKFYTNQIDFNGVYYTDLSDKDKQSFRSTTVSVRTIDENQITPVQILQLFVAVNRGVPQDDNHMEQVTHKLSQMTVNN